MLLRHLYRISLEDKNRWPMWFGLPAHKSSFEAFQADSVAYYIAGLQGAVHDIDPALDDLSPFFTWLRDDRRQFPPQGWCAFYLEQCGDDHCLAVAMLFDFMYEYIIDTMPGWFVELNSSPLPSQIVSGLGVPRHHDIRAPDHIELCRTKHVG